LSAADLTAARLRCTVQESGGMGDSITVLIDRLWVTLDYNVATPGLTKQMHHYKQMMGAA
jgi:hypothetical protein